MLKSHGSLDLTEGPVIRNIITFTFPLFLGQLLQQLYNVEDAWVIGNFSRNDAFAAVASTGTVVFLIIGFFAGLGTGGSVLISRFFGAHDQEMVSRSIHTHFLMAIAAYLIFSSFLNMGLDLLFVICFRWGIAGAALATVISQGVSAVLCVRHLMHLPGYMQLDFRKLKLHRSLMKELISLGLPAGLQNAVITVGNLAVQKNINSFGPYAMAGQGAYARIEGFVFLPIMSLSLSIPTFISQNLGARQYERAKKGARFGVLSAVVLAELVGVFFYLFAPALISFFVSEPESVRLGASYARVTSLFYFLLAFAHATAGVMRGCGKAVVPMANMLIFWCGIRIVYVTTILHFIPQFRMIAWAYPLTWGLSDIIFAYFLLKSDWVHNFDRRSV